MKRLLTDRKVQLKVAKHLLILMTTLSAIVYIIGFHVKRSQWRRYYEEELAVYGMDDRVITRFSDLMFIAMIAFTIIFTLIYIHLIVKEIVIGVLVISVLQLVSLVYGLALIDKPIALSAHELIISTLEMMCGFGVVYLLKAKARDQRTQLEEKECFSA